MEANLPLISVIVPSFNQGDFLKQALDSIFSQDYRNVEVIVMDGGSKDNSASIIRAFKEKLKYWQSEPDGGQSAAINMGVKHCEGDLVTWLNSDDFYLPGALNAVASAYVENSSAPFYFGNGLRVNEFGNTTQTYFPSEILRFDSSCLLYGLNYILQPSTFINQSFILENNLLNIDLNYGMDYDLWLRLEKLGTPKPINSILSASREYSNTKTSTGSFERVEELRKIVMQHSGEAITPGIICYFLDTLHRYVEEEKTKIPSTYSTEVLCFWQKTAELLDIFGARPDGFPKDEFSRITKSTNLSIPAENKDPLTNSIIAKLRKLLKLK